MRFEVIAPTAYRYIQDDQCTREALAKVFGPVGFELDRDDLDKLVIMRKTVEAFLGPSHSAHIADLIRAVNEYGHIRITEWG